MLMQPQKCWATNSGGSLIKKENYVKPIKQIFAMLLTICKMQFTMRAQSSIYKCA